jgi:hypothetical protein
MKLTTGIPTTVKSAKNPRSIMVGPGFPATLSNVGANELEARR